MWILDWLAEKFSSITSPEWAAWVQAIGSILAIIAAIQIGRKQHREAVKLVQAQDLLALERRLGAIEAVAGHAHVLVESVHWNVQEKMAQLKELEAQMRQLEEQHEELNEQLEELNRRRKRVRIPLRKLDAKDFEEELEVQREREREAQLVEELLPQRQLVTSEGESHRQKKYVTIVHMRHELLDDLPKIRRTIETLEAIPRHDLPGSALVHGIEHLTIAVQGFHQDLRDALHDKEPESVRLISDQIRLDELESLVNESHKRVANSYTMIREAKEKMLAETRASHSAYHI